MAAVCSQIPPPQTHIMNSMASTLRLFNCRSCFYRQFVSFFSGQSTCSVEEPRRRGASVVLGKALKAADTAVLKENWLDSLSCPSPPKRHLTDSGRGDPTRESSGSEWVIGIDPDLSGALAVLTTDKSGCTAQVFDSPHLQVLVSRRIRKRLDAKSIIHLLRSIDAPSGTTAYLEQSTPYPKDGKQGWWSGGFGYGMWIGILVASGFSVVPVSSMMWKNEFKLAGGTSTKDDSRRLASELFPSLGSQLSRKKDHGRAEALLIAAYGKGMKTSNPPIPSPHVTEELIC